MNIRKFVTTDSRVGRCLCWVRASVECGLMVAGRPSRRNLQLSRYILTLKPGFTMANNSNLVHLYDTVQQVMREGIDGVIVECGVWNGGSAAMMARAAADMGKTADVWCYDSFQGLPSRGTGDGWQGLNHGSIDSVHRAFELMHVKEPTIIEGWFEQTLQSAPEKISVLHVDADWYESTLPVLERLYSRVAKGGYVVVNDYGFWPECTRAVDEFAAGEGVSVAPVTPVGCYWRKP